MNLFYAVTTFFPVLALATLIVGTALRATLVKRAGHPLPYAERHGSTRAQRARSYAIIFGSAALVATATSIVVGSFTS